MPPIEKNDDVSQDDLSLAVVQRLVEYEEAKATGNRVACDASSDSFRNDGLASNLASVDLLHRFWPDFEPSPPIPYDAPPPKTLGDFRLIRELGRGGMGTVFEAEQQTMGRHVALKVLPFAALAHEKSLQRFRNEVRAAAALDHPHIVSVYSIGEDRGVHFYAMQLIRGQTLADMIARLRRERLDDSPPEPNGAGQPSAIGTAGAPPPSTLGVDQACVSTTPDSRRLAERFRSAAQLGVQAAEALQHAHDEGVLHRDVKPSNLLLDREGKLYVADFGLARIEADGGLTMTGDVIGTLRYMAPEQALAKRVVVDHRADVYSLGATLYELLTLQPAFGETDRSELLKQIAFQEPKPLRKLDRHIPAELETIIGKAIAKNPDERYQTSQQLADDLQAFLECRPIKAQPPSLWNRAAKWSRRHEGLVWMALAATVAIAFITGISFLLAMQWYQEANHQMQLAESASLHAENETMAAHRALSAETEAHRAAHLNLYRAQIRLASDAIAQGHTSRAESLLFKYFPKAQSEGRSIDATTDVRDWEWYYLVGKLAGSGKIVLPMQIGIQSVAPSADGRQFCTVTAEHVCIWDSLSHRLVRDVHIPFGKLRNASFSPDGQTVAIYSIDGILRLWRAESGRLLVCTPLQFGESAGRCKPEWSPDGTKVATAHVNGVVLWDVEHGTEIKRLAGEHSEVFCIAWRPDGNELAISESGSLFFVNVASGDVRLQIKPHEHDLWSIDWNSSGTQIATGSFDQHVKILDPSSGATIRDLVQPSGVVEVKFSPDDRLLACATTGQDIRLWTVASGKLSSVLTGHSDRLISIDWNKSGDRLLSGSIDQTVRQWNLNDKIPPQDGFVTDGGFQFDRKRAALTFQNKGLQIYDYAKHEVAYSTAGASPQWNRSGDRLAVQNGREIRILDGVTGLETNSFKVPRDHYLLPGWSSDNFALVTRNGDELMVWDIATGARRLKLTVDSFFSAHWSPKHQFLATQSELNGEVQVWDVAASAHLATFSDPQMRSFFREISWSPDGEQLATAGWDGVVRTWEARSGRRLNEFVGHVPNQFVRHVAWSTDGALLASGGWDQSVKIWDAHSGKELRSLNGHTTTIRSIAFSPNSTRLASSDWSGTVKLWDVASGEEILELEGADDDKSKKLAWSADGAVLWSNRTVRQQGEWVYWKNRSDSKMFDAGEGYESIRSGEVNRTMARRAIDSGLKFAKIGKLPDSDRAFDAAESLVGIQPRARLERAKVFHRSGLDAEAVRDLTIASRGADLQPEARTMLAWLLTVRSDHQVREPARAEQMALDLLGDWPQQCEIWVTLAHAQYRLGKWRQAIESLNHAEQFSLYPRPDIQLIRAMSYAQLGQMDAARRSFDLAKANERTFAPDRFLPDPLAHDTIKRLWDEAEELVERESN